MSEEKFSKCEEGGRIFKYGISGVRKKDERKVRRKDFWVEILLSSCSLVGFCIDLQEKKKKKCVGNGCPLSWAPC